MITFEVEARRNAGRTKKMRDDPTYREMTVEMIKEDEEILDALEQFEGGFFGGFEGVASQHRKTLDKLRRSARSGNANRGVRSGRNDQREGGEEEGSALGEAAMAESPKQAEAASGPV